MKKHLWFEKPISLVLAVSLIAGSLFYLNKVGKLDLSFGRVKATVQSYTVDGYVTHPVTNQPQSGRTVTLRSEGVSDVQVQTNASGYYSGQINVEPESTINVQDQELVDAGFFLGTNLQAPSQSGTISRNIQAAPMPYTEEQLTQFMANRTHNDPIFDYNEITYDNQVYVFTTLKDTDYYMDIFTTYTTQLTKIAQQIAALRTLTNVNNLTPDTMLIVQNIDWYASDAITEIRALPEQNKTNFVFDKSVVSPDADPNNPILKAVVHEWGHAIDWIHGYTRTAGDPTECIQQYNRCQASQSWAFIEAGYWLARDGGVITGYASQNPREMFAELAAWMIPTLDSDPEQNPTITARPSYNLEYWLWNQKRGQTGSILFGTGQISSLRWGIQMPTNAPITNHNNLMYITEVTRSIANLPAIFPRNVVANANYYQGIVKNGSYMGQQAVVTTKLTDHHGDLLDVTASLDGVTGTTSDPHEGVYVFKPVGTGPKVFNVTTPPTDYPIPFAGEPFSLASGANYKETGYYEIMTSMTIKSDPEAQDNVANNVWGQFKSNNQQVTVNGLAIGSIPKYPNDGTQAGLNGGVSQYVAAQGTTPEHYIIKYVMGGGGNQLYPIQEILTKSTLAGPPVTTKIYINRSNLGTLWPTGLLGKICDYILFQNVNFPDMCYTP